MLKLDENVQNLSLITDLTSVKTQSLPHSISKKEGVSKPLYKVYVEKAQEATVGKLVQTTSSETLGENAEKGKAIQLLQENVTVETWATFFSESSVFDKCDTCDFNENGAIKVNVKTDETTSVVKSLEPQETVTLNDLNTAHEGIKIDLSSLSNGDYLICSVLVKTGDTATPTEISQETFSGNDEDVKDEDIKLKLTKTDSSYTLTPETFTLNGDKGVIEIRNTSELCIDISPEKIYHDTDSDQYLTDNSSVVLRKLKVTESTVINYQEKTIAKVDFGQDGYNKTHTQKNATVTKNSNYINGLKIAICYNVDELRYVTLGTLKPSTAEITLNKSIIVNDGVVQDDENTALLEKIYALTNIHNVECTTINRSEETPSPIVNWDPDLSEIEELHPQDENGNSLENLIEGSIRLQIGEIQDAYGTDEAQQEGCVILADRPVKEIIDSSDFPRYVLDEDNITSNGVLNRFRSVEITTKDGATKVYFEKESFSVGIVYYNTGVIELKTPVPVIEGTAPSLKCSVSGMKNLKCNILNKGSDGNKYSIKILKDHVELNGDVIYNLSLVLNNAELDTIKCTSNPEGSTIESEDENGNPIDVEVPYIGDLEHDIFNTSFVGNEADLKNLHEGTYRCVNGTDGVDGITAKDYIGYKDESGTAGAWLFDDVKYPAQMWPSLGYTDKEFYMAAQDIAWNRKDTTCVWDIPKGYSKKTAIAFREEEPIPANWWTELYYNWCNDVYNTSVVELPPSYYVTKNSLASYKVNGTWFPVAGKERGTVDAASVINQVPAKLDRDEFITHNINPIYDTGNQGIQIYGNETLNGKYTDLSAAHIARTLTYIRAKTDTYTETLKFELNDVVLWRTWIDYVKMKILEPIKASRGLQWYRVSMGNETTTVEELANRIVRGIIELQFNQDAEIFKLDYVVYSSAADNTTF